MNRTRLAALVVLPLSLVLAGAAFAAPLVVETDPLSPEEQQRLFRLPPGFEIQLVVSDPEIGQPMNLAFDAAGHLWITSSFEYPWPVEGEGVEPRPNLGKGPARDRLTCVRGISATGKPAQIDTVISGLNIPIGHIPVPGGHLVYDTPQIALWQDRDGDGVAEHRTPLYRGFGNVDTHGNQNGFTRWLDGWIYACHGFRNSSAVMGTDGNLVTMQSGNTYRFRADGSRIEHWTYGQVNPFGMCFDDWGNQYAADCHSMPITMLLRGAYYSSFGKPHDGLGFGPNMITHSHGSTGICGVAFYQARQFPADYRDNIFLCNPVNGQVHRDRLTWKGASPNVETQPEFLECLDGWFRPVDVKLGPDGALYVADFYNCIIGHYEVPLEHPKRDRKRGRVWRIVYRGDGSQPPAPSPPDLTTCTLADLLTKLADSNLAIRTQATHQVVDRFAGDAATAVRKVLEGTTTAEQRVHLLWIMFRVGAWEESLRKYADDESPLVRTHVQRILSELPNWGPAFQTVPIERLLDENALVRRAAAESLGRHPQAAHVAPLFQAWIDAPTDDTHLIHTIRIALRNCLANRSILESPNVIKVLQTHPEQAIEILLAVPDSSGAARLLELFPLVPGTSHRLAVIEHVARYAVPADLRNFVAQRRALTRSAAEAAEELLRFRTGAIAGGGDRVKILGDWPATVARQRLTSVQQAVPAWTYFAITGESPFADCFVQQSRKLADGSNAVLLSSLVKGEQRTGLLRSPVFSCPETLEFYVAGHNKQSGAQTLNSVSLVSADGRVLHRAVAPGNDVAQLVSWNLREWTGQPVSIAIVDSDQRGAYAWIAAGKFSLAMLNSPHASSEISDAIQFATTFQLRELLPDLLQTVANRQNPFSLRREAALAIAKLKDDSRLGGLIPALFLDTIPEQIREQILKTICDSEDTSLDASYEKFLQLVPGSIQRHVAELLANDRRGVETLLGLVGRGRIAATVLQHPPLVEKLRASKVPDLDATLTRLTASLPAPSATIAREITRRREVTASHAGNPANGLAVFQKNCAACHQIGTIGKKIGPQLDGVGIRGLERLLEDVIDPNRNVDGAFRTQTLVLTNGQVKNGLFRRQDGAVRVFADSRGEEFQVTQTEIDEELTSPLSLMPTNQTETLSDADFADLFRFLLDQRAPAPTR